jgi:hypothetical protein
VVTISVLQVAVVDVRVKAVYYFSSMDRKTRLRTIAVFALAIPMCIYWWPQWMWRDFLIAFREGRRSYRK